MYSFQDHSRLSVHRTAEPISPSLQRMREFYDDVHPAPDDAEPRRVHEGVDEHRLTQALREVFSMQAPTSIERYAAFMKNMVAAQSIDMAHPRCLAHMSAPPPPFMHELADFMGRLNQNMVKADGSRMLSLIGKRPANAC